jgi:hypothetical protein
LSPKVKKVYNPLSPLASFLLSKTPLYITKGDPLKIIGDPMSTRPNINPFPVISSGSMAADITSDVTVMPLVSGVSYQVVWTGTSPVGDLYLQGSNTYELNPDGSVKTQGTWSTMYVSINGGAPAASMPISGNTGDGLIEVERTNLKYIRLFYDRTSGTGTLNATLTGKVA